MIVNERKKMSTPDYIKDIRECQYSKSGAVAKILKECGIQSFPINVWEIARMLNFQVLEADFKNENTSGMMIDSLVVPDVLKKFNCKRAIILNRNERKSVQSFTIAHELGHFVYDCNEYTNCFDAYHVCREKSQAALNEEEQKNKAKEDEIDEFAAMLLMPEIMFREYISASVNRNDRKKLIEEMAKVCMVEEVAVEKRFRELGIES